MHINRYNPAFKCKVIVDVGGSVKENSCKITILSDDGKDSFVKEKTVVNAQGKRYYDNNDDFMEKIASRVKEVYEKIDLSKLNDDAKRIKEIVLFMPGNVFGKDLIYASNIKGKNGRGLEDVGYESCKDALF